MEQEITKLIKQLAKRKPEALSRIMDLYLSNVYYVAKSILHQVASEEDIEECVQDTFLDAWNHFDRYNPERGTFKTWLLILCKYRALTLRKAARNKPEEVEYQDYLTVNHDSPERELPNKEGTDEIINAINALNSIDREIFIRRFLLEQEINEISNIMKLTRKAVDNRLWRGRNILKDALNRSGKEYSDEER